MEEKVKHNELNSPRKMIINGADIFHSYTKQDIAGKRYLMSLFCPSNINPNTESLDPMEINPAVQPIIVHQSSLTPTTDIKMNQLSYKTPKVFTLKKVSIIRVITIFKRNGIQADEYQAKVILDFLYLLGQTYGTVSKGNTG